MHDFLLISHSILRWAVLVAGIAATTAAWRGWKSGAPWTPAHKKLNLAFLIAVDLQMMLGLTMQLGTSALASVAMTDMKTAMKVPLLRFFAVEHLTLMLAAVALVHVGFGRAKRLTVAADQHKAGAVFFAIALVLMLAGIPWPFRADIGRALLPF